MKFEYISSDVYKTNIIKFTDYRLKRMTLSNKMCSNCDLGILEDVKHIVMQCPFYSDERIKMHDLLSNLESDCAVRVVADNQNFFYNVMGKHPEGMSFQAMIEIWLISGDCITNMYRQAIKTRINRDPQPDLGRGTV